MLILHVNLMENTACAYLKKKKQVAENLRFSAFVSWINFLKVIAQLFSFSRKESFEMESSGEENAPEIPWHFNSSA